MTRAVLVTGATGALGTAVVDALAGRLEVIRLVHRQPAGSPAAGGVVDVHGDVTRTGLGLGAADFDRIAVWGSDLTVIHTAAVTSFSAPRPLIRRVNVTGTQQVLLTAQALGASVVHLGTAFVERLQALRGQGHSAGLRCYLESKAEADVLVAAHDVPVLQIRPSLVVGDSSTGVLARRQGLGALFVQALQGMVPGLPVDPETPIDIVPVDLVRDAIVEAVFSPSPSEVTYVSAGTRAPTARMLVDLAVAELSVLGVPFRTPRFLPPEIIDRLVRPVLMPALGSAQRRSLAATLDTAAVFSCDTRRLPSHQRYQPSQEQLCSAFRATVRRWCDGMTEGAA